MGHLLYLMFRCDFDMIESLKEFGEVNTAQEKKQGQGKELASAPWVRCCFNGVPFPSSSKIFLSKFHYSPITSNIYLMYEVLNGDK